MSWRCISERRDSEYRFPWLIISHTLIRPGRHEDDSEVMIVAIAEGVKGLLRRRRESFVVWAWRRDDASWRRERAFGGLGMVVW